MASVALRGVTKAYPGGVQALVGLDLEVRDGEFLVLLGPSGCGKSTALRLIAGLEEVTQGEVLIGGSVVNRVPPKDRNIAMVFQNYALYPHMSVYKNMAFGLQLRYGGGWISRAWKRTFRPVEAAELAAQRRSIPERVRETARMLGIEPLLGRMPRQLSGGERQRVALGRAMVRQPAVFLFDEPLSNLDAKLRLETRRELKRLHGRLGATMIYVTHDQTEALTLGDRIAVLEGGTLQQVATPSVIYAAPRNRFVAGFVGSPPMNFCPGRLVDCGNSWNFTSTTMQLEMPRAGETTAKAAGDGTANSGEPASRPDFDGDVMLGVRPADISVTDATAEPGKSKPDIVRGLVSGTGAIAAKGEVALVEPHGDDTFLHVRLDGGDSSSSHGEETIVCRTTPQENYGVADRVALALDVRRIHFFDGSTGQRLSLT